MSIPANASMVPRNAKIAVWVISVIAVLVVGVIYMFSQALGHFLWLAIGGPLAFVVAIYLFWLRVRSG